MGSVADTMYNFFQSSKNDGAYVLLYALSIVLFYKNGKERNRFHIVYSVILMLGVVCNPVTVWILSLMFKAVGYYEPIASLVPILIYVPFGIVELLYDIKSVKTQRIVAVLLFIYVAICGNFFGMFGGNTKTGANLYDADKRQIVEYVGDNTESLVLADEGILSFITAYGDSVPLLYGHDIMLISSDIGIMDGYDGELAQLHDMMWEPEKYMEDIALVAKDRGCDIIVVKNFEGAKDRVDIYKTALVTDEYIVYRSEI